MGQPRKKRVVVTAGASGIGRAIAERFLKENASVHICDISERFLSDAKQANPRLRGSVADVSDASQVERFFRDAMTDLGGIDVLVNNAGISGPRAPVDAIDYADWNETIATNLSSMFYCVKQVVPAMKDQGSGCIVNISTSSARTDLPDRLPYVASKVGVLGLTHNLARELGPFGIRCNAILPGLIDNPRGRALVARLADERGVDDAHAEEDFLSHISMRTWIQPAEIAETACFLASEAARHITAQEIAVDGNVEWEI